MFGLEKRYDDRAHAGRALADYLIELGIVDDPLVLGLPRGGVVVAAEVARRLGAELDVLCVRKLGAPGHQELALGAIASGGTRVLDHELVAIHGLGDEEIDAITERETAELHRRELAYRGDRPPLDPADRQVVVVDDGVATGATARSACLALGEMGAREVILAAPVAPTDALRDLRRVADHLVFPVTSDRFGWVGRWYDDFAEVTDDQVQDILAVAKD